MTHEQLLKLIKSEKVPFNYEEAIVVIHNKIIEDLEYKVWELRESKQTDSSSYATCNKIIRDVLVKINC